MKIQVDETCEIEIWNPNPPKTMIDLNSGGYEIFTIKQTYNNITVIRRIIDNRSPKISIQEMMPLSILYNTSNPRLYIEWEHNDELVYPTDLITKAIDKYYKFALLK